MEAINILTMFPSVMSASIRSTTSLSEDTPRAKKRIHMGISSKLNVYTFIT
ncbi:hypothetical protein HanXRQr2_Chr15g0704951 [Helianthus annuus]|uniref:Uncharacterized protein n=1 Tax=Helianthus annuus TaxID=4232 RepID=A0A9K3E3Q6_HELAN|nr:hypothetical protein HanXRQr2_Chr15g0704951 [Helianthus annuus]KAJ0832243.1 hypothetical protein HanPSC8_Chr15g0676491 [Helianthus annuus]